MVLAVCIIGVVSAEASKSSGQAKVAYFTSIDLDGSTFEGGTLTIMEVDGSMPRTARIQTQPKKSVEETLDTLYEIINSTWPEPESGTPPALRRDTGRLTLYHFPHRYAMVGSDPGILYPEPFRFLSCAYSEERRELHVRYEGMFQPVAFMSIQGASTNRYAQVFWGMPEEVTLPLDDFASPEDLLVQLQYNSAYGNLVMIRMMGPNAQQELFVVPFHMGVQPNWAAWQAPGDEDKVTLAEGIKPELADEALAREKWYAHEHPDNKRYYQSINAKDGAAGGVYRKFLGLEPGRAYRVVTRMNTLEMDQAEGDWRFSFHAVAHPNAVELTPEQMAGTAALPDGAEGPDAALVAAFGPDDTTDGAYVEVSTEKLGDIALGPDDDTITVWFRHTSAEEGSGVATDWIRLEKLLNVFIHFTGTETAHDLGEP